MHINIEPTVDGARDFMTDDLIKSNQVAAFGFVKGVSAIDPGEPGYKYTLDPFWSDSLRAVYVLADHFMASEKIEFFEWEWPD